MSDIREHVVSLTNVSKTYRSGGTPVCAVRDVTLSVSAGEIYGFLGSNGAGKSTTIRMLLGLVSPTAGVVRLFGRDVHSDPSVLRRVGSLVDGGSFYPFLSGRVNLELLARINGSGDERIDRLLSRVGLARDASRKVKNYSTGMRQRLGVAAALLHDPEVVILDEPANGLDAGGIRDMRVLIRSLAKDQGKTVFLSSHLLHEVQQVCDRVTIINEGKIVSESMVADLIRRDGALRFEGVPLHLAEAALRGRWSTELRSDALLIDAPKNEAPEVARRLVNAGIDVFRLAPEVRDLEEFFLSVTEGGDADV